MTAYAAYQNPTEWYFQKWKEKMKCNEKMQTQVTITKRQHAEN